MVYDVLMPGALDPQEFAADRGAQDVRSLRMLFNCAGTGGRRQGSGSRVQGVAAVAGVFLLVGVICVVALSQRFQWGHILRAGRGMEVELLDLGKPCAAGAKGRGHLPDGTPCSASEPHPAEARSSGAVATWQVVRAGFTNVRSSKYFERVIGMKAPCVMVRGKREGGWVKLDGEPGYIVISHNGETILEKSPVMYSMISSGTCADHNRYPIKDLQSCIAAAAATGLPNITVQVVDSSGKPEGCYSLGGRPWLATSPSNKGHGVIGHRKPLCSDQAEPRAEPCRGRLHALLGLPAASTTAAPASTSAAAARSTSTAEGRRPSLFCFTVVGTARAELELLEAQFRNRASIFRCDNYTAFTQGGTIVLGERWQTTLVPPLQSGQPAKIDTETFVKAWKMIMHSGDYRLHDWTVKVDLKTVFIPERLQHRLSGMSSAEGVFFSNCDRYAGPPKLFGAIEILSRTAVETFAAGIHDCQQLPWSGWWEERYLQTCLHRLNIGEIFDGHLVADGRCWSAPCTDASKMAFYAYGDVNKYMACLETAYDTSLGHRWSLGVEG